MISREHMRIGDFAAGTVLVYERQMAPLPDPRATRPGGAPQWASRSAQWTAATARARRLAESRAADIRAAAQLADDYRLLAHDLAEARRLMPVRHRTNTSSWRTPRHMPRCTSRDGAWATTCSLCSARRFRKSFADSGRTSSGRRALFLLAIAAGYLLVRAYPGLIALFASPELIASVEQGSALDRRAAQRRALLRAVPADPHQQHRRQPVRLLRRVSVRSGHVLHPRPERHDAGRGVRFHRTAGLGGSLFSFIVRARLRGNFGDVPVRRRRRRGRRGADPAGARHARGIVSRGRAESGKL